MIVSLAWYTDKLNVAQIIPLMTSLGCCTFKLQVVQIMAMTVSLDWCTMSMWYRSYVRIVMDSNVSAEILIFAKHACITLSWLRVPPSLYKVK